MGDWKRFRWALIAAALLLMAACGGSLGDAVDSVSPFADPAEARAKCDAAGDIWICRDDASNDLCKLPNGLACEQESSCPDCTCKCYTAPGK